NLRSFLYFFLLFYYLDCVLIYAHTYVLHYGSQPGNYFANSVSSYHRLYNRVFFNNGFHQEHHWDPKAHWTRMRHIREEILPQMIANRTRILRGPHITAFLEDWLTRGKELPATHRTSVNGDQDCGGPSPGPGHRAVEKAHCYRESP